jgi:hypothetical protein
LVKGAVVVDRRVDYLHGLSFEAVGDLLERPGLLVLDRAGWLRIEISLLT